MTPKVLDISHHNTILDFNKIRAAGIVGIIHKASEGVGYVDKKYAARRRAAVDAGLLWGAYHFATNGDVKKQVDLFMRAADPDEYTLMALDYEPYGNKEMTLAQARMFLELLDSRLGHRAVLYSGNLIKETLKNKDEFFGSHRLWHAQYGKKAVVQKSWSKPWLWQYSDKGTIPGVSGPVDLNHYDGTDEQLAREWTGGLLDRPTPPIIQPPPDIEPTDPERPGFWRRVWNFIKGLFGR